MVFYVIMGVCGCGKSTIGEKLAQKLNIPFNDADDFHTSINKTKMNQGIALTDEDRLPWLVSIHTHMKSIIDSDREGIVACSALKKKYRKILLTACSTIENTNYSLENEALFIYLKGSATVIKDRLSRRTNHFMPADLLDSQLAILEEPEVDENHVVVNIDKDVENIVQDILNILHK